MMFKKKIFSWKDIKNLKKKEILLRPKKSQLDNLSNIVELIIQDVKKLGDTALYKYTKKFDNIILNNFIVSKKKINNAKFLVSQQFKDSVLHAKKNIEFFHINQSMKEIDIETQKGVRCQQIIRPIETVGLYVPAGTAPLVSTVLMLSIPARIAGCKNIILCSPPPIMNEILYVADLCGINNIFSVGGAQAIAALGFGTKTIPKVDKIFGPGNAYVTEAKLQISQLIPSLSIDMIAGPSELLIIADETANPKFIAADILSQAEHGFDSQVILVTPNIKIIEYVFLEINKQILSLSRMKIILQALKNSVFILTENLSECIEISNIYAPEHLIIQTKNVRKVLKNIINAGSIFLGPWSPESVGDYASGTNHVLPTNSNAVSSSGLSILDFQKRISVQELTKLGLKNISSVVETLCLSENMDAHKNAVAIRLSSLEN